MIQSLSFNCHTREFVVTKEELGIVSSQTAMCFGVSIDTVAGHGVPSLSRGVTFMSVVESFLSNLSFDGWSSSPVVAWGTGPSQPSSDDFSAVASLDELIPGDSSLSLKVHSSLEPEEVLVLVAGVGPSFDGGVNSVCLLQISTCLQVCLLRGGGGGTLLFDHHVSKRCCDH